MPAKSELLWQGLALDVCFFWNDDRCCKIWLFWMINLCRSMIYDSSLMSESSLEFPKWFCLVFDCGWQQNPRNVWKSYKRTSHSKTTQYLGTNPNFIYDSLERMNKTQSSSGYFNLKNHSKSIQIRLNLTCTDWGAKLRGFVRSSMGTQGNDKKTKWTIRNNTKRKKTI